MDAAIVFLPVADLDATHAYYAGLLGLGLALDQGACRIYRCRSGAFFGFCRGEPLPPELARRVILTVVDDDVDGWHARLAGAGAPTDGPPRLNEAYRIYHFFSADPDGHRVEFQRFEDPRWPGP